MQQNPKRQPPVITQGLVIREYNGVGEADRFITALTRDKGIIRAKVRGARKIHSRQGTSTALLTYSRLHLIAGRDTYIVETAQPLEVFFKLREDIEKTALAQYFCELAAALCPAEEPAEEQLRVILHGLHHLANDTRPPLLVKGTVECRLLSLAGYMPNLDGCPVCGKSDGELFFSLTDGQIYCKNHGGGAPINDGARAALRHVSSCPLEKCFAFTLPPATLAVFGDIAERFLKAQLGRTFQTLEFYHSLR